MNKTNYPTNMTDNQWNAILRFFDDNKKRKHSYRFHRLTKIVTDEGFRGDLVEQVKEN